MTEVDFVKGKLDAQTLSRQKSLENSATREYEQVRRNLNDALRGSRYSRTRRLSTNPYQCPGHRKKRLKPNSL